MVADTIHAQTREQEESGTHGQATTKWKVWIPHSAGSQGGQDLLSGFRQERREHHTAVPRGHDALRESVLYLR